MSDTTPPPEVPGNGASGAGDGGDGPTTGVDTVEPIEIQDEMERSFLDYAMSVIVSRALPDVRDGLKPVHRRILFDMYLQGYRPDRPHVKCAKVTGDTMSRFHPHGNQAIYDALVRMAQPFSLRHRLIDFHGNYGVTGLPARRRALHRVPLGAAGDAHDRGSRRGHRRHGAQLHQRRGRAHRPAVALPQPVGQRQPGHRRRHGDQHPPAQPGRGRRRHHPPDRPSRGHPRGPDGFHQGPGLSDRRPDPGPPGDHGRLPHRPGLDSDAGPGRDRRRARRRRDRGQRAAVPVQPEGDRAADRRARQRPGARRHSRHPGPLRRRRHQAGDLPQARRHGQRGAQQPLQAHPAADQLRRQHGCPRRRRAPHAQPGAGHPGLHRPPGRCHPPADGVPPQEGRATGPTSSRGSSRPST